MKEIAVFMSYEPADFEQVDALEYALELLQNLQRKSQKNGFPLTLRTVTKQTQKQLGTSAVSIQHQTNIIGAVRAILGLEKGDRIEWVLRNGEIIVRKAEK